MRVLKIDPQIAEVLAPLTAEERRGLLESIQEEGVRDPIVVWKGHDIIADGHNRYDICSHFGYEDFKVVEREWDDIDDVLAWVIKNQLGKRNVTEEQRSDLMARLYIARKKPHGASDGFRGNQYEVEVVTTEPQQLAEPYTIEVVAEEVGKSPDTVRKAVQRYEVKQELAEKTSPATVLEIVSLPDHVSTPQLAVLNAQLDTNPDAVEEFKVKTPFQRSKLAALVRGTAYLDHLESLKSPDGSDGNTGRELAEKFRTSKRAIAQTDRNFAILINKTAALDPDLADWIMNSRQFPIERAGDLLDESGEPNIKMLKFVRDLMGGASGKKKVAFDKAVVGWEEFCKAKESGSDKIRRVIENSAADKREVEKMADKIFGSAQSVCIRPDIKELCCAECGAGFNLLLPSPADAKHCPCCGGSKIESRPPGWSPLEG